MRAPSSVLACAVAGSLACAAPALGAGDVQGEPGLRDVDVRSGKIAPTAAQRDDVRDLRAQATWNQFGTPSTLVRSRGTLGPSVSAATATAAARAWLARNRDLFRLGSVSGLTLLSDSPITGTKAHAVTFRQTVGSLVAAGGGVITLAVTKAGSAWRVVSASSTISGDETLGAAGAKLNDALAWQRAAANTGRQRSVAQIARVSARKARLGKGWKALQVAGMGDIQRTRRVAFPTLSRGYVPAVESLVVDTTGAEPAAYRIFVDAADGSVLARESLVDNEGDTESAPTARAAQATPQVSTYSGTIPATDGACDTAQGPFTVGADAGVRAVDVLANADTPAQDIVLRLLRGTALVAEADTVRTPERIRYAPQTGVPAGDYSVQVCEFEDGTPPAEPRTYSGTIRLDNTAAPSPFVARWRTFPANPPLAALTQDPWNNASTDTRENWCWNASPTAGACDRVVGNQASRVPWDFVPRANASSNTTTGNNARSAESWLDFQQPGPTQFHPVSPTRDYTYPWTNQWFASDCDPGARGAAGTLPAGFVPGQGFDISAAVTNLFVQHNRMHDWSYLLGFTEANWNAQDSNFGLTEPFRENDPVLGSAQAGAALPPPGVYANARNNANMATLPDGSPSITNMYLWQPVAGAFYPPCVDGDYDAAVIGHEYGHMIENRMIGKGANRTGFQAGAMGEAAGDLVAVEQLNENGLVPTSDENPFATGTYATGNKRVGIRNYAPNWPGAGAFPAPGAFPDVDPLNFSDIGYDTPGPEPHSDGEVWVAVNFELRRALVAKYDAQFPESDQGLQTRCAAGDVPVDQCPGNRRWIQLLFDAFLLMPTNPTMVDARNAILAADQVRFGGANQGELQAAFARRGLGRFASQTTGSGRVRGVESDVDPLPDFEAVGADNATVTFSAASADPTGPTPAARVYVGHYEARVSPIADTDPATNAPATATANNLDETALFAPGTYEFIATAPGFGAVRFRRTFEPGEAATVDLSLAPNVASASAGATAAGDVTPFTTPNSAPPGAIVQPASQVLRNLIDDTEATNWQSAANADRSVDGRQVTIDLAGTEPQTVSEVQVSAMIGPVFDGRLDVTQNRFTALRQFEVLACNAVSADCSTAAGFTPAFASGDDAFPSQAPRPTAPTLILRTFTFAPVQATHLRLVVRASQCTGGPAFQGEQDADPSNATDCDTNGPASTRFVRVAEFQAYGESSAVR